MNVFENIHLVLATACEKHEIGGASCAAVTSVSVIFWPNMKAAAYQTRPITRRRFSTTRSTSAFRR